MPFKADKRGTRPVQLSLTGRQAPWAGCIIAVVSLFHTYSADYIMDCGRAVVQLYYPGQAAHSEVEIENLKVISHKKFKKYVLRQSITLKRGELIRILVTDVSKLKRTKPCTNESHVKTIRLKRDSAGDKLIAEPQTPGTGYWEYSSAAMDMIPCQSSIETKAVRLGARFHSVGTPPAPPASPRARTSPGKGRPRTSKSIRTKPKHMQANASKSASMKTASTSTSVRRPSSAAARVNAQASRRRQAAQATGPTSPGLTAQRLNTKENKPAASVTVVDEKVTSLPLPNVTTPTMPEDVVQEAAAAMTVVPCSSATELSVFGMTVDPSKLHMEQQADGTLQLEAHESAQFIDAAYILDEFSTQVLAMMWQETMMSFKTSALSRAAAAAGTCVGCHEPKNDKQVAQALRSPMHGLEPSIPNVLGMSTPADKPIPPFDPSTYTIIKKFAPAAEEEAMAPTST